MIKIHPHLIPLSLCLLLLSLCGSCKTTSESPEESNNPDENNNNETTEEDPWKRYLPFKLEDQQPLDDVRAFLQACQQKESEKVKAFVTDYVQKEIDLQYGSLEKYMEAVIQRNLSTSSLEFKPAFAYQRPEDKAKGGFFVQFETPEEEMLAFYFVATAQDQKIDNILSSDALSFPDSAPAIGVGISSPEAALPHYYFGAIFGEIINGRLEVSRPDVQNTQVRLTYLRNACTQNFIDYLKSNNKNVLNFLDEGREILGENYDVPHLVERSKSSADYIFKGQGNYQDLIWRFHVVREHGQFRIDRQEEVLPDYE